MDSGTTGVVLFRESNPLAASGMSSKTTAPVIRSQSLLYATCKSNWRVRLQESSLAFKRTQNKLVRGVVRCSLLCAVLILAATIAPRNAGSQTISTVATITSIGCGMVGAPGQPGTACFIYINTTVGPTGCNSNSIRWDPNTSPNGQVALAQLTAAFLAGQQVVFVVQDTCWAEWPSYPTIYYYLVE